MVRRRRHPVLAALADADQTVLRLLRTRGHQEPVEVAMRALGMTGEYGAVWATAGVVIRRQSLILVIDRRRPQIAECARV